MHVGRPKRARRSAAWAASLAAMTLAGGVVIGTPATADLRDDQRKVKARISALHDDLEHTSAQLARAMKELQETRSKLPAARNALAAARQAQQDAQARNEQAKADLAVARADEQKAREQLAATQAALEETRSQVAGFAAQLYEEQGTGTLAVALDAADPQQLADRMALNEVLGEIQSGALQDLATTSASLVATQDFLAATRAKVAIAQAATEAALAAAAARAAGGAAAPGQKGGGGAPRGPPDASAAAAAAAQAQLEDLEARQANATGALEREKASEKQRYDDLTTQSDQIAARLAEIARQEEAARKAEEERKRREALAAQNNGSGGGPKPKPSPSANPPASGGFLSGPVRTGWVSSEFGWRVHPILGYARLHAGRDYAAGCGTPVYAAAPGTVVSAGWGGGYGNQVIVAHGQVSGGSLATTYNHLQSMAVGGGSVARGQLVGYVGTTGLSTGCHLHFEARLNGVPKDPRTWL